MKARNLNEYLIWPPSGSARRRLGTSADSDTRNSRRARPHTRGVVPGHTHTTTTDTGYGPKSRAHGWVCMRWVCIVVGPRPAPPRERPPARRPAPSYARVLCGETETLSEFL